MAAFSVNGRTYAAPDRPIVVICLDGSDNTYLEAASARGMVPNIDRLSSDGFRGQARGALPSFTNVNNSCIVTGVPPAITGISGNFFLDPETGEEVMMNDASFLRCETILAAASRSGLRVAAVTAKEKLRNILSHGWSGIAFSSEMAGQAKPATHGIDDVERLVGEPIPEIYSGDASVYVLKAGVSLIEHDLADFLYLSTTDFIQHAFAPEETGALDFYASVDLLIGRLLKTGAAICLTADHGMNAKHDTSGNPNIIFLESVLAAEIGPGCRVVCPITDPYVVHHGALGAFVSVHVPEDKSVKEIASFIRTLEGVTEVYERSDAETQLEIPGDRIGDLVVLSGRDIVIGRTPEDHDLSVLEGRLRSHGGRFEDTVPFLVSAPLKPEYLESARNDLRNFDAFDFVCNGIA